MRALDTNVLARFFVDDADDVQAARQRPAAVAALSERSFVSVTVLLELEWVMRGFYGLPTRDISRVLRALASIPHITLEDRDAFLAAVDTFDKGLDRAFTNSPYDAGRGKDEIRRSVQDLKQATNRLRDRVNGRQSNTLDAEEVLRRGASIDGFMQRYRKHVLPASQGGRGVRSPLDTAC